MTDLKLAFCPLLYISIEDSNICIPVLTPLSVGDAKHMKKFMYQNTVEFAELSQLLLTGGPAHLQSYHVLYSVFAENASIRSYTSGDSRLYSTNTAASHFLSIIIDSDFQLLVVPLKLFAKLYTPSIFLYISHGLPHRLLCSMIYHWTFYVPEVRNYQLSIFSIIHFPSVTYESFVASIVNIVICRCL